MFVSTASGRPCLVPLKSSVAFAADHTTLCRIVSSIAEEVSEAPMLATQVQTNYQKDLYPRRAVFSAPLTEVLIVVLVGTFTTVCH